MLLLTLRAYRCECGNRFWASRQLTFLRIEDTDEM
jgi:hypothetical protein